MSLPTNQMLDRFRTADGWRFVNELALYGVLEVPLALNTGTTEFDLVLPSQNTLQGPFQLEEAYFILRSIIWSGRTHLKDKRGNKQSLAEEGSVSISAGATNEQHVISLGVTSEAYALTAIRFGGSAGGIANVNLTVNKIEIKHHADPDTSYIEILNPDTFKSTTTPRLIDLTTMFGSEGYTDFRGGGGFDIRLTVTNGDGAAAHPVGYSLFGYTLGYDEVKAELDFIDASGVLHHLAVITMEPGQLDFEAIISASLLDTGDATVGTLRAFAQGSNQYYNTTANFDVIVLGSLVWLERT